MKAAIAETPRKKPRRSLDSESRHWLLRRPHRRLVVRLLLQGYTPGEVAKKMGSSPGAVYALMRRDEFKESMTLMEAEVFAESDRYLQVAHRRAAIAMVKSVKALSRLLRHGTPAMQLQAIDRLAKITEGSMNRLRGVQVPPPATGYTQNNVFVDNPAALEAAQKFLEATRAKPFALEAEVIR